MTRVLSFESRKLQETKTRRLNEGSRRSVPPGRACGGWHNRRREVYLERCAILLENTDVPLPKDAFEIGNLINLWEAKASLAQEPAERPCPACGGPQWLIEDREKPSWRDIMSSPERPPWYTPKPWGSARLLATTDANRIESAKETTVAEATKFNARSVPLHPAPG